MEHGENRLIRWETRLLQFFILVFPFMIYPWGIYRNYTPTKAEFLLTMTAGMACVALLAWLQARRDGQAGTFKQVLSAEWWMGGFAVLCVASTFASVDFEKSWVGENLRLEGLSALLSYVALFWISSMAVRRDSVDRYLLLFVVPSALTAVYGILQHFQLDVLPRNYGFIGSERSWSLFDNPNFYGSYLVLAILLSATYYLVSERRAVMIGWAFVCALNVAALLYSMTRSGWLGSALGIAILSIYVLVNRRKLLLRWIALLVMLAVLVAGINLSEQSAYIGRFGSIGDEAASFAKDIEQPVSPRGYIWRKAIPEIPKYFWLGSGPDTFANAFPHVPEELRTQFGSTGAIVDKAHNEYLQILITLGGPALLCYLAALFCWYRRVVPLARSDSGRNGLLAAGIVATVSGYLVQAFFNISVVTVAPFFWILLGLSLGWSTRRSTTQKSSTA